MFVCVCVRVCVFVCVFVRARACTVYVSVQEVFFHFVCACVFVHGVRMYTGCVCAVSACAVYVEVFVCTACVCM